MHAPSPNHDERPSGHDATLLVLHNISLPPGRFGGPEVVDLFLNRLDYGSHPWLERLRGLRSEEHTSELQSLMRISYAVFCLKKKKQVIHTNTHTIKNNQ